MSAKNGITSSNRLFHPDLDAASTEIKKKQADTGAFIVELNLKRSDKAAPKKYMGIRVRIKNSCEV